MKRPTDTYPHFLADGRAFPTFTSAMAHGAVVAVRDARPVPISLISRVHPDGEPHA